MIVVISTATLVAWAIGGSIEQAMGVSLVLLARLKLTDPVACRRAFRQYDLLCQRPDW